MGRGLSDLQKFILKETAKRGILFPREVKAQLFGLKPRTRDWRNPTNWFPKSRGYADYMKKVYGTHYQRLGGLPEVFSPKEVGEKKYNSVSVTISRAQSRLIRRGLIEYRRLVEGDVVRGMVVRSYDYGIVLTKEGLAYVDQQFHITPSADNG